MAFEAYSVAIRLKLLDSVSTGLTGMAGQFMALSRHANASQEAVSALQKRLERLKTTGLIGSALLGAGVGSLALFKAPLEAAAAFEQQVARFKLYGLGDAVNAEAVKFARGMNIIGTSYTDAMRAMNEAQGVFRDSGLSGSAALAGAKLAAPVLAKIAFATASLDDDTQARMRTQSLAMLRFIEMRGGLQSPQRFNEIANLGWKAIQTSGGNVNWEQLRQFMAHGGIAAQGLSDTALLGELEPIIGELKGMRAGTALMTAYNRISGGVRIPNQVAHLLAQSGIWDPKQIIWNSMGGIKAFRGDPLKDAALFASDPGVFYERDILPLYARMGLTTAQQRALENTLIFGRTGGQFFSLYDRQAAVSHRSIEAQRKALGLDASVAVAAQTPQGQLLDLSKQWDRVLTDLGIVALPIAIKATRELTGLIKALDGFANRFPSFTRELEGTVGLFAVLSTIGGSIAIAKVGIGGLKLAIEGLGLAAKSATPGGGTGGAAVAAAAAGASAGWGGKLATAAKWAARLWVYETVAELIDDAIPRSWTPDWANRSIFSTETLTAISKFAGLDNIGADKPAKSASQYVRGGSSQAVQVQTQVNLDGRKVGEAVSAHQARAAAAPQVGTSDFDPYMTPTPAGATGTW